MSAAEAPPAPTPANALIVRAVSAVVVFACVAAAVGLAVRWWPESLSTRHRTAATQLDADRLARFEAFAATAPADRPVILSYHDIAPTDQVDRSIYTVAPEQFDEQMAMLRAAGFTTITQQQMVAFLDGEPVPSRSVLITFDDGTKGVWGYADRILERYGFHATAFVITGSIGTSQPYYLTWSEMRHMRDRGRWDFAGHTHAGHRYVPISAEGDTGPFLTNRRWLAAEARIETFDEWHDRVRSDLQQCVDELVEHGFDPPSLFAHPFGAVTGPTNDVAIPIALDRIVEDVFRASVANDREAGQVGPGQIAPRHLLRIEVYSSTTTDDLFEWLRAASDA